MLVLSRKLGEKVVIGGLITLTVVEIRGNQVRLTIDAPNHIRILRGELGRTRLGPLRNYSTPTWLPNRLNGNMTRAFWS